MQAAAAPSPDLNTMLDSVVSPRIGLARVAVGLAQGVLLYLLLFAVTDKAWPATEPYLIAPMLLLGFLLPPLLVSSLGHLKARDTALWLTGAAALLTLLGVHEVWRHVDIQYFNPAAVARAGLAEPPVRPGVVGVAFLFIAHTLVLAAARDQRRIARYATYFETAWKLGIQLLFSVLFVGALWVALWLGAALFMLVKLDFLQKLLGELWFSVPLISVAFSCAMHITDVRPAIVRGIRTLLLVLMSWLLPVVTLMVGGFLCTLPFTGLETLWKTGHATAVLLGVAALLVVLINAAYQNGEVGETVARVLRLSARLAAMLLLPVTAIAVYALGLRVGDYGWTPDRVIAAACLLVASCYALGYLVAAYQQGAWLAQVAIVNVVAAFLVLGLLLALFTPIADPARLSTASQVGRLQRGVVKAADFDYAALKFDSARYGAAALVALRDESTGPDAALIRERAALALKQMHRQALPLLKPAEIGANLKLWPETARLPAGFPLSGWEVAASGLGLPRCLTMSGKSCDVFLMDFNGDGKQDVLLIGEDPSDGAAVLAQDADGKWAAIGELPREAAGCTALLNKLKAAEFKLVEPRVKELEVAGLRFELRGRAGFPPGKCDALAKALAGSGR